MSDLIDRLDPQTYVIYLEVPGDKVVLLQAFIELYEGLAVVRTLSIKKSLVAVITTPSMLGDCLKMLDSIRGMIEWQQVPRPPEAVEQLIMGYFKGAASC